MVQLLYDSYCTIVTARYSYCTIQLLCDSYCTVQLLYDTVTARYSYCTIQLLCDTVTARLWILSPLFCNYASLIYFLSWSGTLVLTGHTVVLTGQGTIPWYLQDKEPYRGTYRTRNHTVVLTGQGTIPWYLQDKEPYCGTYRTRNHTVVHTGQGTTSRPKKRECLHIEVSCDVTPFRLVRNYGRFGVR
jgi:hypothetical protein